MSKQSKKKLVPARRLAIFAEPGCQLIALGDRVSVKEYRRLDKLCRKGKLFVAHLLPGIPENRIASQVR